MIMAIAIWTGVAALCGVFGALVALRRSDEAGFGGMSIAGRGLLWSGAAGFVVSLVQASDSALGNEVLFTTLGLGAGLVVVGLVLYAVGQKSDGSAAWHDALEAQGKDAVERAALHEQNRYDSR